MSQKDREAVFAALADDNRRLLLDRLRQRNGQSIVELCAGQTITRQAVSRHLAVLEEASLVLTAKQGRQRLHYLNPVPIHAVAMRWLKQFDAVTLGTLSAVEAERSTQAGGRSATGSGRKR